MGKQKSFIIVSSTFLAVILILILIPIFTKGIKDSKCKFEAENFLIEVGTDRGIAPVIYASDKVSKLDFQYTVEKEGIIDLQQGTYSKGAAQIYYWVFNEVDANGKELIKESKVRYNEDDKVSIIDGFWAINNTKTNIKAESDYEGVDLSLHASKSVNANSVECYILNGIQTDIAYDKNVAPERGENGNWFVSGKDTGISYKGIQATIKGLSIGETKITIKGKIKNEEVQATTTIKVCLPDPTGIKNVYIDDTKVVNKGDVFDVDYKVYTHKNAIAEPCQDVTYGKPNNTNVMTLDNATHKLTAVGAGEAKIKLKVAESSFKLGMSNNFYTYVKVIVLDTTAEQVQLVEDARIAIEAISDATEENKATAIANARAIVDKVLADNQFAITNLKDLTKLESK